MKLYLKSGQVGEFYDNSYISRANIYLLCSHTIEFYYDCTKMFVTNTDNIVGIEV